MIYANPYKQSYTRVRVVGRMELEQFVRDFADAIRAVDATRPIAQSARGERIIKPA
jgi:hypothetical protein